MRAVIIKFQNIHRTIHRTMGKESHLRLISCRSIAMIHTLQFFMDNVDNVDLNEGIMITDRSS